MGHVLSPPNFSCTTLYFNGTLDRFIKSQKIHIILEQKSSHYELIEVQKGLQCTCQAKIIVGNGITLSVALLVHITPYWTVMNLQGHIYVRMLTVKQDPAFHSYVISMAG